ncbi:MAG: hypothetical protein KBA26_03515 [Candidatus Delongbacteria bacterium]|nr:hypothetical protein [Candidatus Delongbacteria bacterium]
MNKSLFCIGLAVFLSCGMPSRIARQEIDRILDGAVQALYEEENLLIADHAMAADIKLLEGLIRAYPGMPHYKVLASQALCSYALGFVEDQDTLAAIRLYQKGRSYAGQALGIDWDQIGLDSLESILKKKGKESTPALFWGAFNWSAELYLRITDPEATINLPKIKLMMEKVTADDETYFYGAAHIFWGSYYSMLPEMAGGNIKKSLHHFNRALEISNRRFLLIHYFFLKQYCLTTLEEELFDQMAAEALNFNPADMPEQTLANGIAIRKIQRLVRLKSEFF